MHRRDLLTGAVGLAVSMAVRGQVVPARSLALGFAAGPGASGNGFYADPYSTYSSFIADTTFMGTNGTTTTVSWNGSTLTAPTYQTIQAALTAAAASAPNVRVCLLAGQTWNVSASNIQVPSYSGTTSTSRFAIQGDPAASSSTMPMLTGNGAGEFGLCLGSADGTSGTANAHCTIRKLRITDFANSGGQGVAGIVLGSQNGGVFTDAIIEYCWIDNFQATGASGESGPIYVPVSVDSTPFTVRYCKLGNVLLPGGTAANENHSCVGLYGGIATIYNNEMYACYNAVRFKVCAAAVPNGSSVYNNFIHDVIAGINMGNGGEGPGPNGILIYGNLFGWENINNSIFQSGGCTPYNDYGSNAGSTTPQLNSFYNNTVSADWTQGGFLNVASQNQVFYNNLILCATPITTSENEEGSIATCDYNAYFAGSWKMNVYGSPAPVFTTFSTWQAAHTSYPSLTDLTANPDAHGIYIPNLSSPYNTIAGNCPNYASNDFTLAVGSPLIGAGQSGANMGYTSTNCGPGWS